MTDKPTPMTCPESNILPTQHICGLCSINYVCDICSQRNNINIQVDNNPKEDNQTIPEGKESVVAEKSDDHHLKPASGDAVDIATSQIHSKVQHGPINNTDTQIDDNDPKEDKHTSPVEKDPAVTEKSPGDKSDEFDFEVKERPKQFNNKMVKMQFFQYY